jgi:hypothetical protein
MDGCWLNATPLWTDPEGCALTPRLFVAVGTTVTVTNALFPCEAAEMSVVPGATAVTIPSADTVATLGLDEVQVMPALGIETPVRFWAAAVI